MIEQSVEKKPTKRRVKKLPEGTALAILSKHGQHTGIMAIYTTIKKASESYFAQEAKISPKEFIEKAEKLAKYGTEETRMFHMGEVYYCEITFFYK